jgi:flagellar L-ring protein FlgH
MPVFSRKMGQHVVLPKQQVVLRDRQCDSLITDALNRDSAPQSLHESALPLASYYEGNECLAYRTLPTAVPGAHQNHATAFSTIPKNRNALIRRHSLRIASFSALAIGVMLVSAGHVAAQNNSLFAIEQQRVATPPVDPSRVPLTLADASWTYQAPVDVKKLAQLNDIVKVTVSVKSAMTSKGKIDRKKQGYGDLKLTSWIKFYGGNLGEVGGQNGQAPYGTPEARGDIDNQLQADGNLETADKLSFVISCRIIDKRPNGNCVLEGTWSVSDNEEHWEYSLSGEVRPEDIKPDNSIVSDTIADLKIIKREAGHVRDSYRRGWALEWMDRWMPF